MAEVDVEKTWSEEQLHSEDVSKKDIIKFLHENASFEVKILSYEVYRAYFSQLRPVFCNVALYMFSFVCFEQTMGNFSTFGRLSTLIVLGVFLHNSAYKILTRFFQ